MSTRLRSWLKCLLNRRQMEREVAAEARFHIGSRAEDLERSGTPAEEALRRARIEFGCLGTHQEDVRAALGLRLWDELWADIRYALRTMRRTPGFTSVAVLSLALGIGANTAIFSLINTLLLRELPVRTPGELVELLHRYPGEPRLNGFPWPAYQLIRENNRVFAGLIAFMDQRFHVRGEGLQTEVLWGDYVDGTFFSVLGVKPAIGRVIGPNDDRIGPASAIAVISWEFWKTRYNLDPTILGRRLVLEGVPVTVVGVAARGFSGLYVERKEDVWLPLAAHPAAIGPASARRSVALVGRLKPGVSREQARAETAVLFAEAARASNNPFLQKMAFEMEPAGKGLSNLREPFAPPLLGLMAVVVLLLLIACNNVASMLLARGAARQHELSVRVSLGAGRFRLLRQALTESLLLSGIATLLGVGVAVWGAAALVRITGAMRHPGPPLKLQVAVDLHVLFFTIAVSITAGLLFGMAPALRSLSVNPISGLRESTRASCTKRGMWMGKGLVTLQIALSIILLTAAGLFVGHLASLQRLDLGFERDHVLLITLDPARSGYEGPRLTGVYQDLLQRFQAIPGVRSATLCAVSPLEGPGANQAVTVEGYTPAPNEFRHVMQNWVGPNYFQTLGTPLVAGRDFTLEDQGHPRVAIINQSMVRRYFAQQNPLGRRVWFDGDAQAYEIIGVVGDAKYMDIREVPQPTVYLDAFQADRPPSQFALRTIGNPASFGAEIRRVVRDALGTVPVVGLTTLADQVDGSLVPERLIAALSSWFSALGALLAAIGIYGLLAFTVARRTHEIGIRMALGATWADATRMVLSDAIRMVGAGLAIGIPVALWSKRFSTAIVQHLEPNIAIPIVFGVILMTAVALLAAYVPARRAAHVEPMEALRYE